MKNLISGLKTRIGVAGLSSLLTLSGCIQPPPRDGKAYTQEELNEIGNRNLGAAFLEGGLLGLGMVAPTLKQAAALTGASRAVGATSNLNNQVTAAQAGRTQVNVQYAQQGSQGSIQAYLAGGWEDKNEDRNWDMSELKEVGKYAFTPREEIYIIVDNKTISSFRGISILSEISRFDKEKGYLPYEYNGEAYHDLTIENGCGRFFKFKFDEKSEKRGHYKGKFKVRVQGNLIGELEYMFQNPPQF